MPVFHRRVSKTPPAPITQQLYPVPEPLRDPHLGLDELLGAAEVAAITNAGLMQFQATGDAGVGLNSSQPVVALAMAKEINTTKPATGPSFFLDLGDVIYGNGKQALYANNFYRPNTPYLNPAPGFDGVIVAIPGNHDCEVRDPIDAPSLSAFQTNFVAPLGQQPPMATSFGMKMPNQPGAIFTWTRPLWISSAWIPTPARILDFWEPTPAIRISSRGCRQRWRRSKPRGAEKAQPARR